jgi:two-component system, OmpR family, phosphate regulon response regulator OmpR
MTDDTEKVGHIIVVDDDPAMRQLVTGYLEEQQIPSSAVSDRNELVRHLAATPPSLVLLDLQLGREDGLDVLRAIRSHSDVPIIIITGHRIDEIDRIVGLELGADDYLGKPFNPRELLARVQAVLRRRRTVPSAAPEQREPLAFGRFVLDFETRTLQMDDRPVTLSGSEFALLKIFVNHPMRTLTRERLLELLHGPEYDGTDRGIDVQVWRLRRILESDPSMPRFVQTVRGRGYVFVPNGEPNAPAN